MGFFSKMRRKLRQKLKNRTLRYYLIRLERDATLMQYIIVYAGRTIISLFVLVALFMLVKSVFPSSFGELIGPLADNHTLMFSIFFISESILGIIPPDLFIIWAVQDSNVIVYVLTLAVLSYIGGVISFLLGKLIGKYRFFARMISNVRVQYKEKIDKWGGAIVVLAALTPIPFSPISMLSGSLKYKFKDFVLYSLTRIIRFVIYGIIFYYANRI